MSSDPVHELDVFLHDGLAGRLERLPQARLRFTYHPEWVRSEGKPISLALPVRTEPFEDAECGPFFTGLLPEGDFLRAVARAFSVSADNPFSVLAQIGGECAGAISLGAPGKGPPGSTSPPPQMLPEPRLRDLLDEMPQRPLVLLEQVEEEDGIRISLAGAHDKTGVICRDGEIGLTAGRPPSTHILKLPIARVAEPIANEAYCMNLAAAAGLVVASVEPRRVGDHEFLLVRRYDRDIAAGDDPRIHQEDFCQALGVRPEEKYEGEGGPGVVDCAGLLRRHSAVPAIDIPHFLESLLFNFLIGNHDAHGKNFSLLLDTLRLAPFYDLISTVVFEGTGRKLAMRFGGENRPRYLRRRHLDRLADELEVGPALVRRRVVEVVARVTAAREEARRRLPVEFRDRPIYDRIDAVIDERAARLLKAREEEP